MKYLLIAVFLFLSNPAFPQKFKEGKIIYSTTYQNIMDGQKDFGEMKHRPKNINCYFKGKDICVEERYDLVNNMPNGGTYVYNVSINLLEKDTMSYGVFLRAKIAKRCIDCPKVKVEDFFVINTEETKDILGYKCKKLIAKYRNKEVYTIYYTEELPNIQKRLMPF